MLNSNAKHRTTWFKPGNTHRPPAPNSKEYRAAKKARLLQELRGGNATVLRMNLYSLFAHVAAGAMTPEEAASITARAVLAMTHVTKPLPELATQLNMDWFYAYGYTYKPWNREPLPTPEEPQP